MYPTWAINVDVFHSCELRTLTRYSEEIAVLSIENARYTTNQNN